MLHLSYTLFFGFLEIEIDDVKALEGHSHYVDVCAWNPKVNFQGWTIYCKESYRMMFHLEMLATREKLSKRGRVLEGDRLVFPIFCG